MLCSNCGASLTRESVDAGACHFCATAIEQPRPRQRGGVYIDEKIVEYIKALVSAAASRVDANVLAEASKAEALQANRRYVTPEDVKTVARDVLGVDAEVLRRALDETPVP